MYLTLTSVVFEYIKKNSIAQIVIDLTLTSVVFECSRQTSLDHV